MHAYLVCATRYSETGEAQKCLQSFGTRRGLSNMIDGVEFGVNWTPQTRLVT